MATKIFGVEYTVREYVNGKFLCENKESKNIVAKDVLDACEKVKKIVTKPYSYKDDGKTNHLTYKGFEPLNVLLRAQTD